MESSYDEKKRAVYLVMKYYTGGTLQSTIRNTKRNNEHMDESVIWKYTTQLINTLHALHTHEPKILHGDIDTENNLLDMHGNIILSDFFIKNIIHGNINKIFIRDQAPVPPEVYDQQEYNEKCDIWFLGCVIYELACLVRPFETETRDELKKNVKEEIYTPLPSIYSYNLKELVGRMLCADPNERYSTTQLLELDYVKKILEEQIIHPSIREYRVFPEVDKVFDIESVMRQEMIDLGGIRISSCCDCITSVISEEEEEEEEEVEVGEFEFSFSWRESFSSLRSVCCVSDSLKISFWFEDGSILFKRSSAATLTFLQLLSSPTIPLSSAASSSLIGWVVHSSIKERTA